MHNKLTTILLLGSLALGGCVFAPSGNDGRDHDHDATEPTIG